VHSLTDGGQMAVTGVQFQPLVDALRDVVLGQQIIQADETPVQMLMPELRKPTVLIFGPMPPASSRTRQRWFTTSALAAPENTLATS